MTSEPRVLNSAEYLAYADELSRARDHEGQALFLKVDAEHVARRDVELRVQDDALRRRHAEHMTAVLDSVRQSKRIASALERCVELLAVSVGNL